ncbi:MAG: helix-turn-helix domain-containing protein [Saprospiraceae bacterium]
MIHHGQYILVSKGSDKLAFKLSKFTDLEHFSNIQRLNYYTLIWIQEGGGEIVADFNNYNYQADQLFSFTPYQPFLVKEEKPSNGYIIHFHSDFFCIHKHQEEVACNGVLFNNIYSKPFVEVDQPTAESFEMIIGEINKGIDQNAMAMNELVLSYLKLFLIHASRLRKEAQLKLGANDRDEAFIPQKLKDLIELHFKRYHSAKDYAGLLHMTPKSLGKIAKKHFNKSLTTLISERIIVEAKRELYLTSKTAKEIAFELGYADEHYFSRFFKKNTAISPVAFRRMVGFAKGES